MPLVALWDTETDGLLQAATKMHCMGMKLGDEWFACADKPGYDGRKVDMQLPSGRVLKGVTKTSMAAGLKLLATADLRIAQNGDDFDERVTRKLFPSWKPKAESSTLDTMHLSRLIFPSIFREGPNTHKVEPKLRTSHGMAAWGQRLGEPKDDYAKRKEAAFKEANPDATPEDVIAHVWGTWDEEMTVYMMGDIATLERTFKFLMSQKPAPLAVDIEHRFARIIRRQEAWGFTVDMDKMLDLQARLTTVKARLERELIETYGEFWVPGKVTTVKATRKVKMPDFADVTIRRFGTKGNELKPYVGPPFCHYEEGAAYTPVERVEFSPGSRDHVYKMLVKNHGWKPQKWTDKGAPTIDDDVLRGLPYPEAPSLADFYMIDKLLGYVSGGQQAWMKCVEQEGSEHRVHGRVNTIGTYTFRCSHSKPNKGQVPTRGARQLHALLDLPEPTHRDEDGNLIYHHPARELFTARRGFILHGGDGSGMQLRLFAHHLAPFDGGEFAKVVSTSDPHAWMRDTVGTDLMGEGDEGRGKGKTLNYASLFGGGDLKNGSIVSPTASDAEKKRIGKMIRERLSDRFPAKEALLAALKEQVEGRGYIVGLDGRRAKVLKAHAALATLLQMGEAIVMKYALILLDDALQSRGLRPGVDEAGRAHPELADYEFCANVHDEFQADVRPQHAELYIKAAKWAVPEAGRRLNLKCPLKSDVKAGHCWAETH